MLLSSRRIHTGRVLNLDIDRVRFPDGSTGELEMIRHPGASAVIPVATDPQGADPMLLLLRQFRHAAEGVLWEIPAGRLEPGEAPRACAERELLEEAGVSAGRIEPLTTIWTTPGFTDEVIHLFVASDLRPGSAAHERDEFIEVARTPLSAVMDLVRTGDLCDAKTLVSILYFEAVYRRKK